jgi:hypothetical protein
MEDKVWLSESARKGAAMGVIPGVKMCSECAFKPGTEANNCEITNDRAVQCLMWDDTFCCHDEQGEPNGVCAGYLYAKQFFENQYGKKTTTTDSAAVVQP